MDVIHQLVRRREEIQKKRVMIIFVIRGLCYKPSACSELQMMKKPNIESFRDTYTFIKSRVFYCFWSVTEVGIRQHCLVEGVAFIPLLLFFI